MAVLSPVNKGNSSVPSKRKQVRATTRFRFLVETHHRPALKYHMICLYSCRFGLNWGCVGGAGVGVI